MRGREPQPPDGPVELTDDDLTDVAGAGRVSSIRLVSPDSSDPAASAPFAKPEGDLSKPS